MKIAVAYVPVIHRGVQEFCQRVKPNVLYVLGKSLINEFPKLERDIRSLSPEEIKKQGNSISLASDIRILEKDGIDSLKRDATEIIFSEDNVMRDLAEKYFSDREVSFESAFLRWHKMNAITKLPINENEVISSSDLDKKFASMAREVSEKSSDWWRQIGAVLVKDNKFILSSYNRHKPNSQTPYIDGDPRANFDAGEAGPEMYTAIHAEAGIIAEAAKKGISLEGASMYATTFPCPSCSMQIITAGIKKVYYEDGYSALNAERNFKLSDVELIRVVKD